MSKRDTEILLAGIIESIDKIFLYTKGMFFNNFSKDDRTIDAVVRNMEIIGKLQTKYRKLQNKR